MSIRDIRQQAAQGGIVVRALEKWRLAHEAKNGRKPDGYWHPSSISGCPTAAVYEYLAFPRPSVPHDARLLRIFDTGHSLHHMLQYQFNEAGIVTKIPWPVDVLNEDGTIKHKKGTILPGIEVPIQDDKYRLRGTLDVLLTLTLKFVGEIKTKHSASFAKMTDASEEHKLQAACYHWKALDYGWVDTDKANVIYYSKDDSHIREFMVPITEQRITDIKGKLDTMNNMVENYRNVGTVPDPYYKESSKPPCRNCQWAQACHSSLAREAWINKIKEIKLACNAPAPQATTDVVIRPGEVRKPPTRVTKG